MKTLLAKLKDVIFEYEETRYQVRKDVVSELVRAEKLRIETGDRWYSSLILEYSKSLSKQTHYCIKSSVFRSLLNACFETGNDNEQTYIQLLRILKVEAI